MPTVVLSGGGKTVAMPGVGARGMTYANDSKASASGGKHYFEWVITLPSTIPSTRTDWGSQSPLLYWDVCGGISKLSGSPLTITNPQDPRAADFWCLAATQDSSTSPLQGLFRSYYDGTDSADSSDQGNIDGAVIGVKVDFDSSPMTISYLLNGSAILGTYNLTAGTYFPVIGAGFPETGANFKATIRLISDDFTQSIPSGYSAWSSFAVTEGFSTLITDLAARATGITPDSDSPSTTGTIDALGYGYAYQFTEATTAGDILQRACDSFGGFFYISRLGELKLGQLLTTGTSQLTITEDQIISPIQIELDTAEGLTDGIGTIRNHAPYSTGDVAGSVAELRKSQIIRQHQNEYRTATALATTYQHAAGADIADSLFSSAADGQAELDRWAALFATNKYFYRFKIALGTDLFDDLIDAMGKIVTISHPRFNLDVGGGKDLLLVGLSGSFLTNSIDLKLWGSAPPSS